MDRPDSPRSHTEPRDVRDAGRAGRRGGNLHHGSSLGRMAEVRVTAWSEGDEGDPLPPAFDVMSPTALRKKKVRYSTHFTV